MCKVCSLTKNDEADQITIRPGMLIAADQDT